MDLSTWKLEDMSIAALKKTSRGFQSFCGDNIAGMNSVMGQGLQAVLGEKFKELKTFSRQLRWLSQQVLLLQVSDKEYWLIELRFIDTLIGMLDLGFASKSSGRAEILKLPLKRTSGYGKTVVSKTTI